MVPAESWLLAESKGSALPRQAARAVGNLLYPGPGLQPMVVTPDTQLRPDFVEKETPDSKREPPSGRRE
jgi:hypothetical protein